MFLKSAPIIIIIINISTYRGEETKNTIEELEVDNYEIKDSKFAENVTERTEIKKLEVDDYEIEDSTYPENVTERKELEGKGMEAKVVGGEYANIADYPHSVFLMAHCNEDDAGDYWTCGSSILNQRLLLTAAHCVDGCKGKFKIDTYAGSSNFEKPDVIKQVRSYIAHRDYNSETVFADIAMLFLNGNLPLGKNIQRVIIRDSFQAGTEAQVAGWGVISEQKVPTTKLKAVTQNVWSHASCNKYKHMLRGTICASSGSKQDYPYAGDSGSALVTKDKQQIGLVSFRDDAKPELIIYTDVSYYYPWIKEKANQLYCDV